MIGVCVVAGITLVAVCVFVARKKKRDEDSLFSIAFDQVVKCEEIDVLDMGEVVKYFKNPSQLKMLRENKTFLAVAVKKNEPDGSFKVACCVFDKEKSEVVDIQNVCCYHAKKLGEDLRATFGDKPMVVLQ